VYVELPKWLFVAQLETLEVDDWGIKRARGMSLAHRGRHGVRP
jgi:hypothetical protein